MNNFVKVLLLLMKGSLRQKQETFIGLSLLCIGLLSLMICLGANSAKDSFVRSKSRELLAGDLQISSTRPIREEDELLISTQMSREIETLANLRTNDKTALVELKAVDSSFPLVGRIRLNTDAKQIGENEIWIADELRKSLEIKMGEWIILGQKSFKVSAFILADQGLARGATGFAPRAYIPINEIHQTQLIQPGSQAQYRTTFLMDTPTTPQQIETFKSRLRPDVILRVPEDAVEGLKRTLKSMARYLNVVLLFMAFVSFFAGYYLIQIMIKNRSLEFALSLFYNCKRITLQCAIFLWVLALMTLATSVAAVLAFLMFSALNTWLKAKLPYEILFRLDSNATIGVLATTFINSVFFSASGILKLHLLDLNSLLDKSGPLIPDRRISADYALSAFSALVYVSGVSWLLDSLTIGLYLTLSIFILSAISYFLMPKLIRFLIRSSSIQGRWRIALLNLARPRATTYLIWVSMAWSSLLLAFIPNMLDRAQNELRSPDRSQMPQIFVINLPEEQLDDLSRTVSEVGGELRHATPLIQGRLLKINNKEINEGRLARYPVRLSYEPQERTEKSTDEIVEGKTLSPSGVSIEIEFARRENISLGDKLEFEISGISLTATVENLRKVQWNTFRPNFFILFPNGPLVDFPKSLLATIYQIKDENIYLAQTELAKKYPSVSFLNLASTIDRLSEIAERLIQAIRSISYIAIIITLWIVLILLFFQKSALKTETQLFEMLGATPAKINEIRALENLIWAGTSIVFGFVWGLMISVIVGKLFFDSYWLPTQTLEAVIFTGIVALLIRWTTPVLPSFPKP